MTKKEVKSLTKLEISDNVRQRVLDLILKLQELKASLVNIHYTKEEKKFFDAMWEAWHYFYHFDDKEVYDIFIHTEEFLEYKKFFRSANEYFERAVDSASALNVIAKNPEKDILDLLNSQFAKETFLQSADEVEEIDTSHAKVLVMVGCGPMPETAIYFAENTGIERIIALDLDPEAVFMAGRVIHKLGLDDKITILLEAGENFDYKEADVIHMANFVKGKKEVLDQISKTAKDNTTIIARKSGLLSDLTYEEIYPVLHPRLVTQKAVKGSYASFYVFQKFHFAIDEESVDQEQNKDL